MKNIYKEVIQMKLRLRSPKWVAKKTSDVLSREVSREIGGDCCIKITEAEFGMKDKKVYARFSVEGDMDRVDFMEFVKMAIKGEGA
jgi:hypothetical protein